MSASKSLINLNYRLTIERSDFPLIVFSNYLILSALRLSFFVIKVIQVKL